VFRKAIFYLLISLVLPVSAQKKPVITFSENEGLSNDLVRVILLDRNDILWVGTDNGLSRYNGYRFINYSRKEGLPGNMVWGLTAGANDSLYVACYTDGIALMHEGQVIRVWKFPDPAVRNTFRNLLYDEASHSVVVGTDYGIYLLKDSVFHRVSNYPYTKNNRKKSSVVSLKRYKGRIFFTLHSRGAGVYELSIDKDTLENSSVRYYGPQKNMYALTFYHDTLYTNHLSEWYAIPAAGGEPQLAARSDPRFMAWDMVTLPGGRILSGGFQISDYDAVARFFNIRSRHFENVPWMFQTSGIFSFYFDTLRKIVWSGTENGLKALFNTPFSYYDLRIGAIRSLGWLDGTLLILTRDGVYKLDKDRAVLLYDRESIAKKVIKECKRYYTRLGALTENVLGNGEVNLRYFLRDGEKLYLNTNMGSVLMPDMSKYLPFRTGYFITDSDTSGYYLQTYQPLKYYSNLKNILHYEVIREVKDISDIRRKGDVYYMISFFNGIYAVSGKRVWNLREENAGVDNYLSSMDFDSRGNLWAVSPLGNLFMFGFSDSLFVKKKFDHYNSEIIGNSYKWIRFKDGFLYLATNNGLNIIPEEELWEGRFDTLWFYNRYNGYLDVSTSDPVVADRGYLFVHTQKGLVRIGMPVHREKYGGIRVRELIVDGRNMGITCLDGFRLPASTKDISMTFYLLDYPTDRNVEYRYHVNEGKWARTNVISLPFLKPGRYRIVMEAKDLETHKIYREKVGFLIMKPVWTRWWFLSMLLAVVLGGVYLLVRIRYERLRKKEEVRNRMIRESAELQIKALQLQMSPHFIFNTLNTIQAAVMNKSKEETLDFIGDLSLVIRENLESVSEDYIPLSREISFLQRYAGVEQFRLGDKIKIEFIISVEDTERLLVPPMLIQPLLENSIKHGLLPRREGGEIEVKIDQELEYLLVTVRDNGIGRAKARELVEAKKHQSRGIDLLKKRLDYLNLKNKTNAFRIVFEDLFEDGHPAGTVVRLYLQIIRRKDRQQTPQESL